jgi:hypothetical protein
MLSGEDGAKEIQMVYIVQAVMWGVAEAPQLFLDEAQAKAAYVACAGKLWGQRFTAYCEHHGLDRASFASAQAFVSSIDVSEKSSLNFWSYTPEEAGLGDAHVPTGGSGQEALQQVTDEIAAIKEGLMRLVEDVSHLSVRLAGAGSPTKDQDVAPPGTSPSPSPTPLERPQPDPARYTQPEWQTFVGTVKRLGSGPRNEFYLLPRDDWRQDVYSNRTSLEYWEWVADNIMTNKELAKSANYSVIEAPDTPGCYKFTDGEGTASEDCYASEWEAWCAAGLHVEINSVAAAE